MASAPSLNTFKGRLDCGQVLGTPLLFSGSERVWTETASEQQTGHSGLTSKAEEDFKVSRLDRGHDEVNQYSHRRNAERRGAEVDC